ncbi:MAG: isoprenylcysteine carboxylmethyltransferase family protein [Elusimicrobia bacterium]|nr:isoprenylcysteine carboxylmethyltransferase family protein [Elusimicrobiota bacterium]
MLRTIILLPGTVLVFIPAIILITTRDPIFPLELISPFNVWFWIALLSAVAGLVLSVWTSTLFLKFGEGTPAPWDPPKKMVIRGPYRYVRNPMITGVLLILLAESILLKSWQIAVWTAVFFIGNSIYFPLSEEKDLEKRFGDEYRNYKKNVPRWIPRLRAWK